MLAESADKFIAPAEPRTIVCFRALPRTSLPGKLVIYFRNVLLDGVDVAVPLPPCLLRWEPVNGNVVDTVTDVGMVKDVVRRPHDDGKKKKKPKEKKGM